MLNIFKRFRGGKKAAKRSYSAAASSRLTLDWITAPLSSDAALDGKLGVIRDRSRDLERNNEWSRGYLRALENNVIGSNGISLQMRIKDASGKDDNVANDIIEAAWKRWGRVGNCTICGRYSWAELQRTIIRTIARDGEVIIRKIVTGDGLKLQILEADLLDDTYNERLSHGHQVRMGVEMDATRRVLAYHLLTTHPGETYTQAAPGKFRVRIPAAEIIHLYRAERPGQTRGVPWSAAAMKRLKMLDGYAEAELVAARTGAAKMGFFEKQTPDGWTGVEDDAGNLSMDASPGTIEELPVGVTFKGWDVDHPNSGYGEFTKSMLRGVASSLGISYNTFSNDLENVNFSSIRAGLIEEREVWKTIQSWLIESFMVPVFSCWLEVELMRGALGSLPLSKLWKFDVPEFRARRWGWVDPKKDMEANILAVRSGMKSLRQVVVESGDQDIENILDEQAALNSMMAAKGVTLPEIIDTKNAEVDTTQKGNE